MARDKVKRNAAALASIPQGSTGRPSKALSFDQAVEVLRAAEKSRLYPYIAVSLLTARVAASMR
jgi:hypothetical protein